MLEEEDLPKRHTVTGHAQCVKEDASTMAEVLNQEQLTEGPHHAQKRPRRPPAGLPRSDIHVARTEIGSHHRDLHERMWGQGVEHLEDSVTIRSKQPPVISNRIKDRGLAF